LQKFCTFSETTFRTIAETQDRIYITDRP